MGFTIAKLPLVSGGTAERMIRLRGFKVRASALRDGARVSLNAEPTLHDIKQRLGLPSDFVLSRLGIEKGCIDVSRLRAALSGADGIDPPILSDFALRTGEPRSVENLVRAVVGRIGKEAVALEFNVVSALSNLTEIEDQSQLLAAYLEELFPAGENPRQQGALAYSISQALCGQADEAERFFLSVAVKLTINFTRDLNYRAGLIAGAAGIKVELAASAVKRLCPDEGSIGKLMAMTAQKGRGEVESQAHFAAGMVAHAVIHGDGQAKELAVEVINGLATDEASKPVIAAILCSALAGSREVEFAVGIAAKLGLNAEASRGRFIGAMVKRIHSGLDYQINYIADAAKASSPSLKAQAKFVAAGIRALTGDIKETDRAVRAQMPLAWSAAKQLCIAQPMPEGAEFLAAVIMDLYNLDKLSQAEAAMAFIAEASSPLETAIDFLNIVAERTGIAPEILIGRLA